MTAKNSMKETRGRKRGSASANGPVGISPSIGGMETLGEMPVYGGLLGKGGKRRGKTKG